MTMSRPKATTTDMDDVLALAHARGLKGKFWDDQKRYLVITLPQETEPVDTSTNAECPPPPPLTQS
jgi:hypothetical protein